MILYSVSIIHLLLLLLLLMMMMMMRMMTVISGVISANHRGSNVSYSTTSLSPCYCDV